MAATDRPDDAQIQESQDSASKEPTNVAIVLIANSPKSDIEWQRLTNLLNIAIMKIARCEKFGVSSIRRPDQAEGGSDPSRVLEILGTLSCQSTPQTLSEWSEMRRHSQIAEIESAHGIDVAFQPIELYCAHREPGLAIFDMDSTLIQQEVIDELARTVGRYEQVSAITEAAMRGEEPYTDFKASLRARVEQLKGVPTTIWQTLKDDVISFTPGAHEMIKVLKHAGWKCAVLSGGFTPLANWVKEELGLDYAFANHLVTQTITDDATGETISQLSGELVPEAAIVDGAQKKALLLQLARENGIPKERIVAVGDGSNDLPMMHEAGLGVAFNAKPKVQIAAPVKLNSESLISVLYVLGFTQQGIFQTSKEASEAP